jgi:NitT/TauT family transport system substrate-binding protein
MQIVNLAPAQLITAYANGNGLIAAAWAPFGFTLQDKANAVAICDGEMAGADVFGSLVVRADYADEHPQEVAKVLAVYLRAVSWMKSHKSETLDYMRAFYAKSGNSLSERFLEIDYSDHPIFSLSEELKIFSRASGPSVADKWNVETAAYLKSTGTIADIPDPKSFVTDKFLKMINDDQTLRAIADAK